MEVILNEQLAKLDALLAETKVSLWTIEGPHCRFYHPMRNIVGHPYFIGVDLKGPYKPLERLFG